MVHNTNITPGVTVYPGSYIQQPWKEKALTKRLGRKGALFVSPPVNITEHPFHYTIEMPAPGFEREDFFIHTRNRQLTVIAAHSGTDKRLHPHQFRGKCIKIDIELPGDIDTEFGTAEYRHGILCVYLVKNGVDKNERNIRLAVY